MFGLKPLYFKAPAFWWSSQRFLATWFLIPFEWMVRLGVWGKARLASPPAQACDPVLSVGNLVTGGAGKTPVVKWLASFLGQKGFHPLIVSRGYGGRLKGPLKVDLSQHEVEDVGDEAWCSANHFPTYVASPRSSVLTALKQEKGSSPLERRVLILDDAHQHTSLAKDFSFVVVNGKQGFGNGHVLPAGPLREPIGSGLKRAQGMFIIGQAEDELLRSIHQHAPNLPLFQATLTPISDLQAGDRVFGFAGIGFPEKFKRTLEALDVIVTGFKAFPDHYPYQPSDLKCLARFAQENEACLVTTEKDWVRLPKTFQACVRVVGIELKLEKEYQDSLERLLDKVLGKTASGEIE